MNIQGLSQYSKATVGLRAPKKNLTNRLIFIYPILLSDKIKIDENTIRDFIAITFLKEIFMQNAISMVSTANQVKPLWDESNKKVDALTGAAIAFASQYGYTPTGGAAPPLYPIPSEYSGVIQQKIQEKTAVIQTLLKTDPKLSKLRPYVEMVTLGNMIDVPVIAGTSPQQINTLCLFHVLLAAISLRLSLTSTKNLDTIFNALENLDETRYFRLLNNLAPENKPWGQRTREYLFSELGRAKAGLQSVLHKALPIIPKPTQANFGVKEVEYRPVKMFHILNILKTDLDQTKLFFKFVLDPSIAKSRYGVETTSSEEAIKVTQLFPGVELGGKNKSDRIKSWAVSSFLEELAGIGTIILRSISNIVIPQPSVDLNFAKLKNQYIDNELMDNIDLSLDKLIYNIMNNLSGSTVEYTRNKMEILKALCKLDSNEVVADLKQLILYHAINSIAYSPGEFRVFTSSLDRAADVASTHSKKIENLIDKLGSSEDPTIGSVSSVNLEQIYQNIQSSISDIFKEYIDVYSLGNVESSMKVNGLVADVNDVPSKAIPNFINSSAKIIYFLLLQKLQEVFCRFILVADLEIETAANDVTEWPNYTMVLPIEIITALHAATVAKSWESLVTNEKTGNEQMAREYINITDDFVKGIVKFISNRLQVPNLIVVDSKRNDIYYKLMYQTEVNKTKLSTFETFVKTSLNQPMSQ